MNRRIAVWLATLCLTGIGVPGALAQASPRGKAAPAKTVERKHRAPVNKEILRVRLPRPQEVKLENGLSVLVLEHHKLPVVNFALWIKTGALTDPKELPGLAKFTAEMLREGTTHRSSTQLANDVDEIGASLGATAEYGASISTVNASGLVENVERILELMSDMVLNPTFPGDELEKYKTRQLAALEQQRSLPAFVAREKLFQVLYRDFPAAIVSTTPGAVAAVTTAHLQQSHSRYYVPSNALLGVVGDLAPERAVELIRKYFGGWKDHAVEQPSVGTVPAPAPAKVYLVDRPDSVQTNIVAGNYAVRRADPEFIPLTVMNRILGGGPSARLFLNLREEKGYTYGVYSDFDADIYRGPWIVNTEVQTAVTDGALRELMAEFKRIRERRVPQAELDEARRAIVAGFALSLEQPATLLESWMLVKYYNLAPDYWDRYTQEVAKVNAEAVQQAAQKFVDLEHLQIVCVGNGKQIKDVLKKYGPLEVYDTDGKRLE
jgi:predicted Zn-dependent peptidase